MVTICTAQWSLYVPHSGHYMYRQFNIQKFHVLPTQCIYLFCVDLRTNSDYFPIQHWLISMYSRYLTPYSPVVTVRTITLTLNNSTFCLHNLFLCSIRISEQTAIISLYNINWLVCTTETQCVYCAVRTGCLNIIQAIVLKRLLNSSSIFSTRTSDLVSSNTRLSKAATGGLLHTAIHILCKRTADNFFIG